VLIRQVCTIAAMLLFALRVGAIPTGILYNNLGNGTQTTISVTASGPLYDSFSTGPFAVSLSNVQLKLQIVGPILYRPPAEVPLLLPAGYFRRVARVRPRDGGGSITVGLYADSSTSPGALLASIGTLTGASLSMTPANFNFPLSSVYPLFTNQRYWIGISTMNGSIAGWAVAQNNAGVGVANEFWYASGMVHPNTDPPFQMQVGTAPQSLSAVPAPPALLWALVGFAGAGLYWNRRKLGWSR
jgi:hypothetical protein